MTIGRNDEKIDSRYLPMGQIIVAAGSATGIIIPQIL